MLEMKENRVYRPFLGGKMLDELSGTEPASDGHYRSVGFVLQQQHRTVPASL